MTAWTRWPEVAAEMERHPDGKRLVAAVRQLEADAHRIAALEVIAGRGAAEGVRVSWTTFRPLPGPERR